MPGGLGGAERAARELSGAAVRACRAFLIDVLGAFHYHIFQGDVWMIVDFIRQLGMSIIVMMPEIT